MNKKQNFNKEALISQQDLKELFWLNRDTGDLMNRLKRSSSASANAVAGWIDKPSGYRRIKINGVQYRMHRLVWLYHFGEWPVDEIDHINGERLDNRIDNLRVVTNQENCKNQKLPRNNKSGVTGVHFNKHHQKWQAQIKGDGKLKHLGSFANFEDAVAARKAAEILYGFHENHGRKRCRFQIR